MLEQLNKYVHNIFAPYQEVKTAKELEEELLSNLNEKFNDYKRNGYSRRGSLSDDALIRLVKYRN